jgi:hypothetical protein
MPSSDPSEVTLYKLTSETVLTGRGYSPEFIQVQMRSIEEKKIWFSHDLVSSSHFDCGGLIQHTLPVYHYVKRVNQVPSKDRVLPNGNEYKTEHYYFAIEPALKSILEMPFKNQLREALQSELKERKKALAAQRQLTALSRELAHATAFIARFQDAPLLRRLWIALRPVKNWPEATKSTTWQNQQNSTPTP